ncbi:MAG: putative nucleotidyltransferase substrate binding domain-containing protein [Parachlamydiaceae bacterium]
MDPISSISPLFQQLQQQIDQGENHEAIVFLQNLFSTIRSEAEAILCYESLFALIPTLPSLDQLENNLPHLLERFPRLSLKQKELALHIGNWFFDRARYCDAMHAFGKALQIETSQREDTEQTHRQTSQIFVRLLQESRLPSFLPSTVPTVKVFTDELENLKKFSSLCLSNKDLAAFYSKASDRLCNIPYEQKGKYASCQEELNMLRMQDIASSPVTQKYWSAFQDYRKQFSHIPNDPQQILHFQETIAQAFKDFFHILLEDIFLILGPAPCSYDIRAMGSLGRQEICPYSDLEFMILIKDTAHKSYFMKVVEILEIQIASLGETERFRFIFTCIHPQNPSGLHIDYPPKTDDRLIQTPEGMAKLQQRKDFAPNDIECTTRKTASLSSNDPALFSQYQELLQPITREQTLSFLKVRQRDFQERWTNDFPHDCLHLKEQFVELLFHPLSDLALYYGIQETNTLQIVDQLVSRGIFTEESGKLLKESIAAIYRIRIRLHLFYQRQKEEAFIRSDVRSESSSLVYLTPSEVALLVKTYWLVVKPLHQLIDFAIRKQSLDGFSRADCLQRCSSHASIKQQHEFSIEANFKEQQDPQRQILALKALGAQALTKKPKTIILQHATQLDTPLLTPFIHKELHVLDLSYCSRISDSALHLIHAESPSLQELFLDGTAISAFRGGVFSRTLAFPKLQELQINHCPHLHIIQLHAPKAQQILAKHNPLLQTMEVRTALRGNVDCTASPQVKLAQVHMECVQTLKGHTDEVRALAPLGDGILASGSIDKTIKVWDLQSGSCLKTLKGHTD